MILAILNGKKANNPILREIIFSLREQGHDIAVRVTWESQDMMRFVNEAASLKVSRIVVAGGDGSANEAVNALDKLAADKRPELALIPMGTANDFATANAIPIDIKKAFQLALTGKAQKVDYIKANDRCFLNVAAAGFGAEITADTPIELKNIFGGSAYTLTGLAKALGFRPYQGSFKIKNEDWHGEIIVGAFCNSRLAGGGQLLAPQAMINDGLMDVTLLKHFQLSDIPQVIEEIQNLGKDGTFIRHLKTTWLEIDFPTLLPLNLDGEPYHSKKVVFKVQGQGLSLVLPNHKPCIAS